MTDNGNVTFTSDQIKEMLDCLRDTHEVLTTGDSGRIKCTPEQMAMMQINSVIDILTGEDDDDQERDPVFYLIGGYRLTDGDAAKKAALFQELVAQHGGKLTDVEQQSDELRNIRADFEALPAEAERKQVINQLQQAGFVEPAFCAE
jgi:hypothetical protein